MSNLIIQKNLSSNVKVPANKSAKEIISPLLESWENIISKNPADIKIKFDTRYCKDFDGLMKNTLLKGRLEAYENACFYYQSFEMWIDVCISYTDSEEKTHRFVFFSSHPDFMKDDDFYSVGFGMEVVDKDGTVCDSVNYSSAEVQGKNISLQGMFEELGLTDESKPLVDFIGQERQNT